MIVEIRNAGFLNRGAEMMLKSAQARVESFYDEPIIALEPTSNSGSRPIKKILEEGFYIKSRFEKFNFNLLSFLDFFPKKILRKNKLINEKEINLFLDATGFGYSDKWGEKVSKDLSDLCDRIDSSQRLILLPQAYGPFNNPKIESYVENFIDKAERIYVRDKTSLMYLENKFGKNEKFELSFDFTTDILPQKRKEEFSRTVLIIPNARLFDKGLFQLDLYLSKIKNIVDICNSKNLSVAILQHEYISNEDNIIKRITLDNKNISVIQSNNIFELKGIIASSYATVSSRYHALISALMSNIPSIAIGWSHKYLELYEDFNIPQLCFNSNDSLSHLEFNFEEVIDQERNQKIALALQEVAAEKKILNEIMWENIFNGLN